MPKFLLGFCFIVPFFVIGCGSQKSLSIKGKSITSETGSALNPQDLGPVVYSPTPTPTPNPAAPIPPNTADSQLLFDYSIAQVPINPVLGISCAHYLALGFSLTQGYFGGVSGNIYELFCDQSISGGGWAMLHNSVLGVGTTQFWNIPYAERLSRKGIPGYGTNYYDGSLYLRGSIFMDVVEDLNGKSAVLFVAQASGFNSATMRFINPHKLEGESDFYLAHFASGWSSSDYDGDVHSSVNCSTHYSNVTQHMSQCFLYSLGSDAEPGNFYDGGMGPHILSSRLPPGLTGDGTLYTRVRRITRYVRW